MTVSPGGNRSLKSPIPLSIYRYVASTVVTVHAPESFIPRITPLFARYPETNGERTTKHRICFTIHREEEGLWRVTLNGEPMWRDREPGNIIAAIELELYRRTVSNAYPLLRSLHAAAVVWHGEAVAFAGISGAGKSSLCTAALLDGADYLSDEFLLLDGSGTAHPFPRPLQWESLDHPAFPRNRMEQSGLFDRGEYRFEDADGEKRTSQLWLPRRVARAPRKLTHLIFPRFTAGADTELAPLTRSAAIVQLAGLRQQSGETAEWIHELHRRVSGNCRFHTLHFGHASDGWRCVRARLTRHDAEGVTPTAPTAQPAHRTTTPP